MLKIFKVTFNDGGWHSSLPSYTIVAENKEEAIKKIGTQTNGSYDNWDCWATEFTIPGYIIEVYDESTYLRNKNIEKII